MREGPKAESEHQQIGEITHNWRGCCGGICSCCITGEPDFVSISCKPLIVMCKSNANQNHLILSIVLSKFIQLLSKKFMGRFPPAFYIIFSEQRAFLTGILVTYNRKVSITDLRKFEKNSCYQMKVCNVLYCIEFLYLF